MTAAEGSSDQPVDTATNALAAVPTTTAAAANSPPLQRTARAAARRAATVAAAMARAEASAKDEDAEEEEEDDGDASGQSEEDANDSEFLLSEAGGGGGAHTEATEDSDAGTGLDDEDVKAASSSSRRLPRGGPGQLSRFASTGQTTHDQFARPTTPRRLTRGSSEGASASTSASAAASSAAASSWDACAPCVRNPVGMLVCDYPGCGRSFRKLGKLNRHKLSHAPGKAFVCTYPGCDKSFTRNDRLRRHWKIHQARELELGGPRAVEALNRAAGAVEGAVFTFVPDSAEAEAELMRQALEEERMDMVSGSDIEPFVPDAILRRAPPRATAASSASAAAAPAPVLLTSPSVIAPVLPPLVKFHCTYGSGCNFSFLLREHLKRHQITHGAAYVSSKAAAAALAAPASAHAPQPADAAAVAPAPTAPESGNVSSGGGGGGGGHVGRGRPKKSSYPCTHAGCFLVFDKSHKLREHAFVHSGVLPWICNAVITKDDLDGSDSDSDSGADGDSDGDQDAAAKKEQDEKKTNDAPASVEEIETAAVAADSSSAAAAAAGPISATATPASGAGAAAAAAAAAPLPPPVQYCKEGFMTRAQLTKHQHLCHDPKRHLCGEAGCGAMFVRFQDLRKHRAAAHRSSGPQPAAALRCTQCGATFKRTHDRDEHALTHMSAAERAAFLVPCPFTMEPHSCSKSFTTRSNLNQHVRRVHDAHWKGQMRVGETGGAPVAVVLRYPCPFPGCTARAPDKPYKVKQTLQRHMMSEWHGVPRDKIHDTAFIQGMVAEAQAALDAGQQARPVPAHPNTAKAASTRTRLTGASVPAKKNLESATHKRKRVTRGAETPEPVVVPVPVAGETKVAEAGTAATPEDAAVVGASSVAASPSAKDESNGIDTAADAPMPDAQLADSAAPATANAAAGAVQSALSEQKEADLGEAPESKRQRLDPSSS